MTDYFVPELGQIILSNNTPWNELPMQEEVEAILWKIGEQILDRELAHGDPMDNSGAQYENETFKARAYCWCEGELHPEGCPPNFEWRDFRACWYKHAGRGNSQNRELSMEERHQLEIECLASLPAGNPGNLKRRRRAFMGGLRVCECGHYRWMHPDGGGCNGGAWEPEWEEREIEGVGNVDLAVLPAQETEENTCPCSGFKLARKRGKVQ